MKKRTTYCFLIITIFLGFENCAIERGEAREFHIKLNLDEPLVDKYNIFGYKIIVEEFYMNIEKIGIVGRSESNHSEEEASHHHHSDSEENGDGSMYSTWAYLNQVYELKTLPKEIVTLYAPKGDIHYHELNLNLTKTKEDAKNIPSQILDKTVYIKASFIKEDGGGSTSIQIFLPFECEISEIEIEAEKDEGVSYEEVNLIFALNRLLYDSFYNVNLKNLPPDLGERIIKNICSSKYWLGSLHEHEYNEEEQEEEN